MRQLQSEADAGIELLSADARACIRAASELYCGIVDEVEKIDYQIFNKRAKTSNWRRVRIASAPVEDLFFGFSMIVMVISQWIYWGRRGVQRN